MTHYLFLFALFIAVVSSVIWAIRELRVGAAKWHLFGSRFSLVYRETNPSEFWLIICSKMASLPIGAFILWRGWANFGVSQ
jgi:hypothetical protein